MRNTKAATLARIHQRYQRIAVDSSPARCVYQTLYDIESITQTEETPEQAQTQSSHRQIQWLHIVGVDDAAILQRLLAPFAIHPLVIEDILNSHQRPKMDDYEDYLFFAGKAFSYQDQHLKSDQVYVIVGEGFIISCQMQPLGIFSKIRQRLLNPQDPLRQQGADFLGYALLDSLVDDYYNAVAEFGENVEIIDNEILNAKNYDNLIQIHHLKREVVQFRWALLPMMESLTQIMRGDFALFTTDTHVFIRDTYDHILHLVESLDALSDNLSSIMEFYLSQQSNNLNLQMRTLTVVSIIFMPLTLIVGIYGMNFDQMPELHWRYGYAAVLAFMAILSASLGFIFYRKHWF